MTNILNKINSLFPISDDTVQVLKENVTCCRFPKKYQLIKADTYCKSAFFIEKGITRSFWLVDGEEVTTSFAGEGSIVFSMDELYYGKISEEYVETLEEVEAYQISLATLTHLFETNIELCNWGRIIHQNEYRRLHRSHKDHLTGKGAIRSVQGTISGRISASKLRIYRFLPGYQTFYTQQAPGKRIIEFDIGQIFYPQKRILLPHITNI